MSYIRRSTIDQHRGEESPGMHFLKFTDIVTDLSTCAERPYEELTPEDRDWWDRVLDDVHAAEVELASLDAGNRHVVQQALLATGGCDDLECLASYLRDMMAHLLEHQRD